MDTLQHDLPNLETQIPPIHEQFAILEKYEVPVQDSVSSSGVWSTKLGPCQQQGVKEAYFPYHRPSCCQEGEQRSVQGRRLKIQKPLRAKANSNDISGQL